MITDLQTQSVLERYHSDKHFSEFFLPKTTRWRQRSTGINVEQNCVTVITLRKWTWLTLPQNCRCSSWRNCRSLKHDSLSLSLPANTFSTNPSHRSLSFSLGSDSEMSYCCCLFSAQSAFSPLFCHLRACLVPCARLKWLTVVFWACENISHRIFPRSVA